MKTEYSMKDLGKEVELPHSAIQAQFSFLQGKVLTVVEAALEGDKLEAVKSLIKKMFSEQQTWVTELCYPDTRMMTRDEAQAKIENIDEIERQAGLEARGAVDEGQ